MKLKKNVPDIVLKLPFYTVIRNIKMKSFDLKLMMYNDLHVQAYELL